MKDAEVIGIVGDVRQRPDSAERSDVYVPYLESPGFSMMIFVRTIRDPSAMGNEIRRAIHDVAPRYPIYDMQTMTDRAAGATAQARFSATLLTLFAITATGGAPGLSGALSIGDMATFDNATIPTTVSLVNASPHLTAITLAGRDSKILVAGYRMGAADLRYSTSEIMTHAEIGSRDVALLYGRAGEAGETESEEGAAGAAESST